MKSCCGNSDPSAVEGDCCVCIDLHLNADPLACPQEDLMFHEVFDFPENQHRRKNKYSECTVGYAKRTIAVNSLTCVVGCTEIEKSRARAKTFTF